jgi:hypothetical protein
MAGSNAVSMQCACSRSGYGSGSALSRSALPARCSSSKNSSESDSSPLSAYSNDIDAGFTSILTPPVVACSGSPVNDYGYFVKISPDSKNRILYG